MTEPVIGGFQKTIGMTRDLRARDCCSKPEQARLPVIGNVDFGHTTPIVTFPIAGTVQVRDRPVERRASNVMVVRAALDWYGCATFRLTVGELVVFLDAYIDRVDGAMGTELTAGDIDRCDFIVVGHSHFDHLWGRAHCPQDWGDDHRLV